MKISKEKFVKFLKLTALSGDVTNKEALLEITDKGLKVLAVSGDKMVALFGTLDCDTKDLGDVGDKIGLDDISLLSGLINNFSAKDLIISKKANKLKITADKDSLKISCTLRSPEYILNALEESKFNSLKENLEDNYFTLNNADVKKLINYVSSLSAKSLSLEGKDNQVSLTTESNENSIVADFKVKENLKGFNISLGKFYVDILSVFSGDIKISASTDKPVLMQVDNFEYLIAPRKK